MSKELMNAEVFTELEQKALSLCYGIEQLPASALQTKLSTLAAGIFHELTTTHRATIQQLEARVKELEGNIAECVRLVRCGMPDDVEKYAKP